ncbi:hypothetical protein AM1H77_00790 [Apilactobacillus micheneri]
MKKIVVACPSVIGNINDNICGMDTSALTPKLAQLKRTVPIDNILIPIK